jgi:2,3-bisphosphoglycerate-dependent phosphoglycerate mutase
MATLALVRHGQSQWNLENRFTGWVDVALSAQGEAEARAAGSALKALQIKWDFCHSSRLMRAQKTLEIIMKELGQSAPTTFDSALNERHYGDLQGLDKDETRKNFGEEQVLIWRRSFDQPPPHGESLSDTSKRSIPYFREYVLKDLEKGKNVLIVAHGNSLRSIVMFIEKMTSEQILKFEMATGVPHIYQLKDAQFSSRQLLSGG